MSETVGTLMVVLVIFLLIATFLVGYFMGKDELRTEIEAEERNARQAAAEAGNQSPGH